MRTPYLSRLVAIFIVSAAAACSSAPREVPVKEVQVQGSGSTVAQPYALEEPDIGGAEALTAEPPIQGASLGSGTDVLLGEIVNGGRVYLSQFAGKVVLVNYWSTSCAPCAARLREMAAVSLDYQPLGLVVAHVNIGDVPDAARTWLESKGLGYFSGLQLSDARAAGGATPG